MKELAPPDPSGRVAFNPAQSRLKEITYEPNHEVLKRRKKAPRLNRWERPPEPHDWRFYVGIVGRTLITLGLLMFGFVAYQLWGTGIQEARSQDVLKSEIEQIFAARGIVPDTLVPEGASPITSPVHAAPGAVTPNQPPVTAPLDPTSTAPTETVTSVDAVAPTTVALAPVAVRQELPPITAGSAVGLLNIPRLGVSKAIVAGVSVKDLREGPGHFPNTPFPGQLGNAAIAGHRTTYGSPFLHIDELQAGDAIEITTILGDVYLYQVTASEVVSKADYFVVTNSDPNKATLTLVTCTPIGTASHRLITYADLVTTRSSPVGEATINYGQDFQPTAEDELPVEEPPLATTIGTDGVPVPVTIAPGVEVGSPAPEEIEDDANTAAAAGFDTEADAFSQGWFADNAAWPHVAAWGAGLLLLWWACYRLAKRVRRTWVGVIVAVVPCVVLLYFFYENVNRLLPAAI